ncbi:MAG: hypothetical protein ACRDMZ_18995 [Solirubrobacteraceae bacterium]
MTRDRWPLAMAGLGSLAFALLGTAARPAEPGFAAEPASIAAFYESNVDGVLASQTLYFISTLLLMCFAAGLYSMLRRERGGSEGQTAAVAFAGAIAGCAMLLGAGAASMMAALRADEAGRIAPDVATVLWDMSSILYGLAAPMAMAVLVLAVAVAALRGAALPAWLGVLSVPLGIALALPPINHVAIIAFQFWVGIAAVGVLLHGASAVKAAAPRSVTA